MKTLGEAYAAGAPIIRPSDPINEHFAKIERQRPRLKRAYRACDRDELAKMSEQALAEQHLRQFPPAERLKVAAILAAEVERLFPRAKMEVLAEFPSSSRKAIGSDCHQCAYPRAELWLGHELFILPWAPLAPEAWRGFKLGEEAWPHSPVPAEAASFAKRLKAAEEEKQRVQIGTMTWPLQFKHKNKRYPTWGEIAEAWPYLAALIGAPSLPHPTEAAR